jgi:hypothetical protein
MLLFNFDVIQFNSLSSWLSLRQMMALVGRFAYREGDAIGELCASGR